MQDDGIDGKGEEGEPEAISVLSHTDRFPAASKVFTATCLWLRVSFDRGVLAPGLAIPTSPFLLDRVQREQLAAIFRLMKERSDTFGEMSEGDMKEQLRLYDI